MKPPLTTFVFAFLTCCALFGVSLGQSRGGPQTFEGTITLRNRNSGPQAAPASMAGVVVSEATDEPLPGAKVTLSHHFTNTLMALLGENDGIAELVPVKTNEKGEFSFHGLGKGSYDLSIELDGYQPRMFGGPEKALGEYITLAEGERLSDIKVSLVRSARVEGHIRSETGAALSGVPLQLFQLTSSDRTSIAAVGQTASGPDGSYHVSGFPFGSYVLTAGLPIATNGLAAQSFAGSINVPNTDPHIIDISLQSRGEYRIRGKLSVDGALTTPEDRQMTIRVTPATTAAMPRSGISIPYNYSPEKGSFEIPGLLPGLYEIHASLRDPAIPGYCAATFVVVSNTDVDVPDLILRTCL